MCEELENHESGRDVDPQLLLPTKSKTWQFPVFGGIFDILEVIFSVGKVHNDLEISMPTRELAIGFIRCLLLPFISIHSVYSALDLKKQHKLSNALTTIAFTICHGAWIALFACGTINHGFIAFAWSAFFINACILTSVRMDFRSKNGIVGNAIGDFIASSFLYPQALLQMEMKLGQEDESLDSGGEVEPLQKEHDHEA